MTDAADTEITIQGILFRAPQRYSTGHVLSALEAEQLNSVYHDNLRNNFAKTIKKRLDEIQKADASRTGLNATELLAVKDEFARYAEAYQFTSASRRLSLDPVERTAQILARDLVTESLRKQGKKPADLPDSEFDAKVASVATNVKVRAEAQRRVDATRAIAGDALDIEGV